MKRTLIFFSVLALSGAAMVTGCPSKDTRDVVSISSYVEESVIAKRCAVIVDQLRAGLPSLGREFSEASPAAGECARFILPGGFMDGAEAVIILENPDYGETRIVIYQPYRSWGTNDFASRVMRMAE